MVNNPNIRFAGFADDWVQRKLGDFIKISRQQEVKKVNLHEEKIGYYVLGMRTFDFDGYIDYSKPYWVNNFESVDDDLFLNRKEFAIIDADMDASLPKIGKVLLNATNTKFLLAAHIRKIKVDVQVDSIFAYALMRTTELVERLKLEANGSIAKGLLDKNVYKQKVYLPRHLEEQQQIGEFFWTLEKTITHHQYKLDLLKDLKKGYLQKMFPKNGAKVPELRFAGFADDWEERKLGDVSEIKDSARIPNTEWEKAGVPYLRSSDLSNGHIDGELFLSFKNYEKYANKTGAPEKGDLLFASGGDIGIAVYKDNESPVYVQGGSILYVKTSRTNKLDGLFLQYAFESPKVKSYIKNASTGTSLKHFVLKPANSLPILFSSIEEQKKIGSFFKQLDDTITHHQRKLDLLKDLKKGLLQQMFV